MMMNIPAEDRYPEWRDTIITMFANNSITLNRLTEISKTFGKDWYQRWLKAGKPDYRLDSLNPEISDSKEHI